MLTWGACLAACLPWPFLVFTSVLFMLSAGSVVTKIIYDFLVLNQGSLVYKLIISGAIKISIFRDQE